MKKVRVLVLAAAVSAFAVASVGCSGAGAEQAPQTSANALSKAPVGANTHGFVKVVGDALGEVALRPEQRTELEKLAQEAEARHGSMAAGRKDLMLAFADQVEKGSIDRAALQPKIDRIAADVEKSRPGDQAAFARVHDVLDAEQRNAFVDALQARFKGHHGGKHHEGFGHMKQLADELQLTDAQKAQIKDAFGDVHHPRDGKGFEAARAKMQEGRKALETFRTDKFDVNALPKPELDKRVTEGTMRMVGIAEKVLPILTPEQRKIAADKLRTFSASPDSAGSPLLH